MCTFVLVKQLVKQENVRVYLTVCDGLYEDVLLALEACGECGI
jgi:hypothetical protein